MLDELVRRVPLEWTQDQRAAVAAMRERLQGPAPTGVLQQRDVGTGATAVALWAASAVAQDRHQAALLAPTEVLAEQHHAVLQQWLAPLTGDPGAPPTASLPAGEHRAVAEDLRSGRAPPLPIFGGLDAIHRE